MEINIRTVIIIGPMGSGKTVTASVITGNDFYFLSWGKPRVFSNFEIKIEGKKINKTIHDIEDLQYVEFSPVPGVAVIDEMGLNYNSKDFMTEANRRLTIFHVLARKKNLSPIFIGQAAHMIPKDQKILASLVLRLEKRGKTDFVVYKERRRGNEVQIIGKYYWSPITLMSDMGLSYNQLDESIMNNRYSI
jgi:hypothetical protein